MFRGMPLNDTRRQADEALALLYRIGDATNLAVLRSRRRYIDWLATDNGRPTLDDETFDEAAMLRELQATSVSKSMLAGLAGLAVGAGAVLTQGLQDAMGQMNAASTLQAQLGSASGVAAAQGKIAGKLYGSGVSGTSFCAASARAGAP